MTGGRYFYLTLKKQCSGAIAYIHTVLEKLLIMLLVALTIIVSRQPKDDVRLSPPPTIP